MEGLINILSKVYFFVEADSFSRGSLWETYHHKPHDNNPVPWKQYSSGDWQTLPDGTCVSFWYAQIYDKLVCFYTPTSMKVDYQHIEDFLKQFRDAGAGHCDANNFHQCLGACKE